MWRSFVVLGLLFLCGGFVFGRTITVAVDGSGDYSTIQAGIDGAVDGDEVVLVDGIYTGTGNRDIDFLGKSITVRGNLSDPNLVVIDCQGIESEPHRGFSFISGEDGESIIEGFTITKGYGPKEDPDGNGSYFSYGGGIYCVLSTPTIRKCIISGNSVSDSGGGIFCRESSPDIQDCIISDNSADFGGGLWRCNGGIQNCRITGNSSRYGGGLYECDGSIQNCTISGNSAIVGGGLYRCDGAIEDCVVTGNSAKFGGGLHNCVGRIRDCTISNNTSDESGGGLLYCNGTIQNCLIINNSAYEGGGLYECDGTIQNCTISGNSAGYFGGGLYNCEGTITACRITSNSATTYGGGLYGCDNVIENCNISGNSANFGGGLHSCNGVIQNCTITGNDTYNYGGGLYRCDGMIENCTISGNTAAIGGGLYYCIGTTTNSIIWSNNAVSSSQMYGSVVPTFSCIQDFTGGGIDNISDNPLFVDSANGDYHLSFDSPCINGGVPSVTYDPNDTDIDGNLRVVGGRIDIGSCEFSQAESFLFVSTESLEFTALENGPAPDPQLALISNHGTEEQLNWSISYDCSWLTLDKTHGTIDHTVQDAVTVLPDITGLSHGIYICELSIFDPSATNSPQAVTVTLTIYQPVMHLFVKDYSGNPVFGVEVAVTGFAEPIIVDGDYELAVPYGWSGTITPSKDDTIFVPTSKSYENVTQEYHYVSFSLRPYSGGEGTEEDPYLITDADDLRTLADDPHNWGKYFIMTNDIDMGDPNVVNMKTISSRHWSRSPFFGTFDGQGFSIMDMHISDYESSGLFGDLGMDLSSASGLSAKIRNLVIINPANSQVWKDSACFLADIVWPLVIIENCKVEGGRIDGEGSLAEKNYGTIKNCHAIDVYVEGSQPGGLVGSNYGVISNCSVSGTVIGDDCVGGLVGWSGDERAVVEDCSANCSVQGFQSVGGLIGMNKAGVFNSFAVGNVTGYDNVGGLIGDNFARVTGCYSTGDVSGRSLVGGLIGHCTEHYDIYGDGGIERCFASGSVSGDESVGGLVGANFSDVSECYSTGSVSGTNEVGGLLGYLNRLCNVTDCYTHSDVLGSGENVGGFSGSAHGQDTIFHCFSTGTVRGSETAGGFVGFNWFSAPSGYRSCFWNIEKSPGLLGIGGITDPNLVDAHIIAETTENMQIQDTYAGWDFVGEDINGVGDVWRLCLDGVGYPRLSWEFGGDFACPDGVGVEDLVYLCERWLEDGLEPFTSADRTGDGVVGFEDFGVLAGGWME